MEAEFDKEIDAILRKAHRDGPVLVGDFAASRHLDADEISAFAENALPEKSRTLYMAHLAECDRCRKILSSSLSMNLEAAPAAAAPSVITIAERSVPWYKSLFLFPNLAYVMGGLVLVFGGFLAFSVVRNSTGGDSAIVSQISESDQRGGPNFQNEAPVVADSANASANVAANMTVQSNSSVMAQNSNSSTFGFGAPGGPSAGEREDKETFSLDGAANAAAPAVAPPPPPAADLAESQPAPKDARLADDEKAKLEMKPSARAQESAKTDSVAKQGYDVPSQAGPMRNNESQYNRQLENLDKRRAAAKKTESRGRDEEGGSGRRVVSGKTFERKQGVWYDVTYQGRPTINVRRGSDEYNRLDSGLRSIANSLGGTVVVVWGAKAYRIQ